MTWEMMVGNECHRLNSGGVRFELLHLMNTGGHISRGLSGPPVDRNTVSNHSSSEQATRRRRVNCPGDVDGFSFARTQATGCILSERQCASKSCNSSRLQFLLPCELPYPRNRPPPR